MNREKRLSITSSTCGKNSKQFCTILTLKMVQANHTGLYSCKYISIPASKNKRRESSIYIFINGKTFIFYVVSYHFAVGYKFQLDPLEMSVRGNRMPVINTGREKGMREMGALLVESLHW